MNLFRHRPLCLVTVFFVLTGFGCLLLPFVGKLVLLAFLGAAAVTCGILLFKRHICSITITILLAFCALQCVLSCLAVDLPLHRAAKLEGEAYPTRAYVTAILHEDDESTLYKIKTMVVNGETCRLSFLMSSDKKLSVGDVFTTDMTFRAERSEDILKNSYSFTIGAVGNAEICAEVRRAGVKNTPQVIATRCRNFLIHVLEGMFDEEGAALLGAMLLGDRTSLSDEAALSFERAGVTHLLALSGMHITILTFAVRRVLDMMKLPGKLKIIIAILFVFSYSMLVGMPLSILRAAGMTTLLLLGGLIRRERDAITSLSASVLIILLISPRAILDLGFWLSVTATLGILLVVEFRIGLISGKGFRRRILRIFLTPLMMTLAASLFTLPITAFAFGEISLLSLPANLIFPEVLNYIIYLGLAAIPLPFLRPLVNHAVHGYLWVLDFITQPRGIILSLEPFAFRFFLVALILLTLIFLTVKLRRPRRMLIPIGILFLAMVISVMIPHIAAQREESLTFISDDFHNDYVIIKNRGHNIVYISAEFSEISLGYLADELRMRRIHEIDLLCISHYHTRTGGYLNQLAASHLIYEVAAPLPRTAEEEDFSNQLRSACAKQNIPLRDMRLDIPLTYGDITVIPHPRSITTSASHAKVSASFMMRGRVFYYASGGYYYDFVRTDIDPYLEALSCDTLLLGSHSSQKPPYYPVDGHVTTILYGNDETDLIGYDDGTLYPRTVIRARSYTFRFD